MSAAPANSYTEWGPLRESIVGRVEHGYLPDPPNRADLSFRLFFHDNIAQAFDSGLHGSVCSDLRLDNVRPYSGRVCHLGDRFRVHIVEGLADNHIDSVITPLALGILFPSKGRMTGPIELPDTTRSRSVPEPRPPSMARIMHLWCLCLPSR